MVGYKSIKEIALSVLKGITFYILSVLILSAVFWIFAVNEAYIPIVKSGLSFISAFLTGLFAGSKGGEKGYLRGLIGGILLVLIFIGIDGITASGGIVKSAVTYFIMVIISVSGGIIGVNVKK